MCRLHDVLIMLLALSLLSVPDYFPRHLVPGLRPRHGWPRHAAAAPATRAADAWQSGPSSAVLWPSLAAAGSRRDGTPAIPAAQEPRPRASSSSGCRSTLSAPVTGGVPSCLADRGSPRAAGPPASRLASGWPRRRSLVELSGRADAPLFEPTAEAAATVTSPALGPGPLCITQHLAEAGVPGHLRRDPGSALATPATSYPPRSVAGPDNIHRRECRAGRDAWPIIMTRPRRSSASCSTPSSYGALRTAASPSAATVSSRSSAA